MLDLARANGQIHDRSARDANPQQTSRPRSGKTGTVSQTSDPLLHEYSWLSPAIQTEHQPAIRIDYNLGDRHRSRGTHNKLWQDRDPDQLNEFDHRFPDTPNNQSYGGAPAERSIALRSTLSRRWSANCAWASPGASGSFSASSTGAVRKRSRTRRVCIDLDRDFGLTNWHTRTRYPARSAYQYTFDETLNWQKGSTASPSAAGRFSAAPGTTRTTGARDQSRIRYGQRPRPPACSRPANFAGASGGAADRRAGTVRDAHGARRRRHRSGRARSPGPIGIRQRQPAARGRARQLRGLRPGLLAAARRR